MAATMMPRRRPPGTIHAAPSSSSSSSSPTSTPVLAPFTFPLVFAVILLLPLGAPSSSCLASSSSTSHSYSATTTSSLLRPRPLHPCGHTSSAAFFHRCSNGGGDVRRRVLLMDGKGMSILVPAPQLPPRPAATTTMTMSPLDLTDDDLATTNTMKRERRYDKENEPTYDKSSRHPSRPADSLLSEYDEMVRSAHVRHVLLETREMADLALKGLFGSGDCGDEEESSDDPFGDLARSVSACSVSRKDGGRLGWIDNPNNNRVASGGSSSSSSLLPDDVIRRLFGLRPLGGDVHVIPSDDSSYHIIRVDDLQVDYIRHYNHDGDGSGGGSRNRIIKNRSKLPGVGIRPNAPAFDLPLATPLGGRKVVSGDDGEGDASTKAAPTVTSIGNERQPRAKTYHISTVGCQMNVADSERMAGVLNSSLDLTSTPTSKDADVVILNTCSIRDHAEQKLYDQLGPHAARKRRGEHVAIVVSGCVAQQEGEDLLRRVPEVDAVVGPQYAARLGDVLLDVSRGHQVVATDPTLLTEDMSRPVRGSTVRAWVNVIHGCNEHCTYCVVPHVRGVEQSRSMESILDEIRDLGRRGYREVTLLGQNIDAYGRDMTPRRTFADLLRYLNDHVGDGVGDGGIQRIRYVTSHPRYFSDRVIDAVAELDMVCECFHMPFQSGDDDVLRCMRRGYTHDSYMKIIDKIKKRAADASICGDVIVGFPGESEAAFQRTLDLMNEVKFDNLNTFAYSPRPNTEASRWTNQIPEDVKSERLRIVQKLAAEHARERSERYVGDEVEVLVEERNMKNPQQVMGRTRQGRPVFFDGDIHELCGSLERVKITEARPWSLTGYLL